MLVICPLGVGRSVIGGASIIPPDLNPRCVRPVAHGIRDPMACNAHEVAAGRDSHNPSTLRLWQQAMRRAG